MAQLFLEVEVLKAEHLLDPSKTGKVDPYCILTCGGNTEKTVPCKATMNPVRAAPPRARHAAGDKAGGEGGAAAQINLPCRTPALPASGVGVRGAPVALTSRRLRSAPRASCRCPE